MSEAKANPYGQRDARNEEPAFNEEEARNEEAARNDRCGPGAPRMLPTVNFGLRAAVLAGVVAVAGVAVVPSGPASAAAAPVTTTVGLGGAISGLMGPADTTCCGGGK